MTTKKELTALEKEIKTLERKLDKLLKEVEKDVKVKAPKASKTKAVKVKPAKKAPAKRKTVKITDTDKVLNVINRLKKGADVSTIKKKTGFDDKKIRNILFNTLKKNKIQRSGRGHYLGLKAEAPDASREKAVKAEPAVTEPVKIGAKKLTATDQVLKIVNEAKKGVNIITIKKETGFEDKKIRNIIFRATKEGKIQRADRGLYVVVK